MLNGSFRNDSFLGRRFLRSRLSRLLRAAGRAHDPGEVLPPCRTMAEPLESRLMLAGFNPGGDVNVATVLQGATTLQPSDVSIFNIGPDGTQYDRVRITGNVGLDGVLKLRFHPTFTLTPNSTFDIIARNAGVGDLSGAFQAIEGLRGPAGSALDLVAIQSPAGLRLVATDLPVQNLTVAAATAAEADALTALFQAGSTNGLTGSQSIDGVIHAMTHRIDGRLTFTEFLDDNGLPAVQIDLGPRASSMTPGKVTATVQNLPAATVFGTGTWTLRNAPPPVMPPPAMPPPRIDGLRLASFQPSGFSLTALFGDIDSPTSSTIASGQIGPLKFTFLQAIAPEFTVATFAGEAGGPDEDRASVAVGFSVQTVDLAFTSGSQSGVTAKITLITNLSLGFQSRFDGTTFSPGTASGRFTLEARRFELEVPNVVKIMSSARIFLNYDPNDPAPDQLLVAITTLSVEVPKLHLKATLDSPVDATSEGLKIYKNGFQLGLLDMTLDTSTFNGGAPLDARGFLQIGSALRVKNPKLLSNRFGMRFNPGGGVAEVTAESFGLGAEAIRIGPEMGEYFAEATSLSFELTFPPGPLSAPDGFRTRIGSFKVNLGRFVELTGSGIRLDTGAADDERMLIVDGNISAMLKLRSLFNGPPNSAFGITGSAGGFAIRGDGTFEPFSNASEAPFNANPFHVDLAFDLSNATDLLAGVKLPAFLRVFTDASGSVSLRWPNFNAAPERFLMQLSFSLAGGRPETALFSFSVQNLTVDTARLGVGPDSSPFIFVSSVSGSLTTRIMGTQFAGSFILGVAPFNAQGEALDPQADVIANPDLVARSVIYAGASGEFRFPNGYGVELMFGFSELGFLQAYMVLDAPVLLDPNSGLTISGFRGGVTFNAPSFPDIEDPADMRSGLFKPTRRMTPEQWEARLGLYVANQLGGNPGFLFRITDQQITDRYPRDGGLEGWVSQLDSTDDPGLFLPEGLRLELGLQGFSFATKANLATTVQLDAGDLWLLNDRGQEYVLRRNRSDNSISVYSVGFSIADTSSDTDAFSNLTAVAAPTTAANVPGLIEAFAARRIVVVPTAAVRVLTPGLVWELDNDGSIFRLEKMGTTGSPGDFGSLALIVTGGNGTFGGTSTIRIEAGFTLYSQYATSSAVKILADAIIDPTGKFLLAGEALFGDTADAGGDVRALRIEARMFFDLSSIAAANAKIFFLGDFSIGGSSVPLLSIYGKLAFAFFKRGAGPNGTDLRIDRAYLSSFGVSDIRGLFRDDVNGNDTLGNNPDYFKLELSGSDRFGIAVLDAAGLPAFSNFAVQRFVLGGKPIVPLEDGRNQFGYAALSFDIMDSRFDFEFDASLSAEGLISAASIVSAAGNFTLDFDNSGGELRFKELVGVAHLNARLDDIEPLRLAGVTGALDLVLKINTTSSVRTVVLQLPNRMPETFNLRKQSFGFFASGHLTFSPPVVGGFIHQEIVGAFGLEIDDQGFQLFILGSMPVPLPVLGPILTPLQADVLGVLLLRRSGDSFQFGARLEVARRTDLPPQARRFIDFQLALGLYINATGQELSYQLPTDFASRFDTAIPDSLRTRINMQPDGSNQAISVVVPAGAPRIGWGPVGAANMLQDAPGAYIVLLGSGAFSLGDQATTGVELNFTGGVRIKFGIDASTLRPEFAMDIRATTTLAPLGSFSVDESLKITATPLLLPRGAGATGAFRYDTWHSLALNGIIRIGQLEVLAALSVDINTSSSPREVRRFYDPVNRRVVPLDQQPIPVQIPGESFVLFAGGELRWSGVTLLAGEMTFVASSQGMMMTANAVLRLQPLSSATVVGSLDLYSSGDALGYLSITADFSALGFRFGGNAFLKLNTFDSLRTLTHLPFAGGRDIPANTFEVYVSGRLDLTMFGQANLVSLSGQFWLNDNPQSLSVRLDASLSLLDFFGAGPILSIGVDGFATIDKVQRTLVMNIGIAVPNLGIPHLIQFGISNTRLLMNTGGTVQNGVAPGLRITASTALRVVGLTVAAASGEIVYEPTAAWASANGAWRISLSNLSVDFFGIISLSGSVDVYSRGAFRLALAGSITLGSSSFGATFNASMLLDFRAQNDTNKSVLSVSDLIITGTFAGRLRAGVTIAGEFIGATIGGRGTFNYNASTREMTVTARGDFPEPIGEQGGTFSLGTLDFAAPPPPPRLAGPATGGVWTSSSGVLHLYVGARAGERNFLSGETSERYTIEAVTTLFNGRQRIRVTAFGLTQDYDGVTSIIADFGTDADTLLAGLDGLAGVNGAIRLAIPITITGGDARDTITVRSGSMVVVFGNAGDDLIDVSAAGGSIDGGAGNDTITWLLPAGASNPTLAGGGDTDVLEVLFTDAADNARIDGLLGGFAIRRLSAGSTVFDTLTGLSFEHLRVQGRRGADTLRVSHLAGIGLNSITVDLSRNDNDADLLIVEGTAETDTISLSTPADSADADGDGNTSESILRITRSGGSPVVDLINSSRADGDSVTIDAGDGGNTVNASTVTADIAAIIILGGAGDDTFTGSPFADALHAGHGRNTIRGGSGGDTITSGDGDDLIFGDDGNDTINAGNGHNVVFGGAGSDTLTTGSGNDHLDGGDGNDTLIAGAGNDTLIGGDGNDTLDGDMGDDTFTGGLGQDVFMDAGGRDTLIETRPAGAMTITDQVFIVGMLGAGNGGLFADQYLSTSELEMLNGIFQVAILTGGPAGGTMVVGDVDGRVRIGGLLVDIGQQFHGRVDLIGGGGADRYIVTIFGTASSVINVIEVATDAGDDSLAVFGSNSAATGDTFLLRRNFVAALPPGSLNGAPLSYDRVNYPAALELGLSIDGLDGDDLFVSDDNGVAAVINGGGGADLFQVGQVFGSDRIAPNVAPGDEIGTTQVDLTPAGSPNQVIGFVTNGASHRLVINGGDGADRFVVFRNIAAIELNGGEGNDRFTVRSLALAGPSGGTRVDGGMGADFVEFASNSSVQIDGGDGLDVVRILGTQFADTLTVDGLGVQGTGLNVRYSAVESIELHAGDGDDVIFILGTAAGVRVAVFGGAGSDRFLVTGVAPHRDPRSNQLGRLAGPLLIEGGPGDVGVFGLPGPIMVTGEVNAPLPPGAGGASPVETSGDVDLLDILGTDATDDLSGAHGAAVWPDDGAGLNVHTLSGLGMGAGLVREGQTTPGGISYRRLEVVDIQLGSGAETLSISSVAAACTTVFRGNGGSDTFILSAASQAGAMVVIFGDNAVNVGHTGAAGDDRIDASTAGQAVTVYGGAGSDTILGGRGPDRLFGGSGPDVIGGGDGDDLILGDSGIDFDRSTRITIVRTSGLGVFDHLDLAAADTINPGDGSDIVFGDHGLLNQFGNMPGVLGEAGLFATARTTNTTVGGDDMISARSDTHPAFGTDGAPSIAGGNDLIFGGLGVDTIISGAGDDVLLGDHGAATFAADGSIMRVESTDPLLGGGESITAGGGHDRVIGGNGSDVIDAGDGDDVVFGDHGLFDVALPVNANFLAIFTAAGDGGAADTVYAGAGNDIVLGQQGDDLLLGQDGDDDLIGGHNVAGGADELDLSAGSNDRIDGGRGNDTIAGDNAMIVRILGGGARFRTLVGTRIYLADGSLQVTATHRADPRGAMIRAVTLLDHDAAAAAAGGVFGHDLIAGNSGDDVIFGQLGDDLLRGDGVVSMLTSGNPLLASPESAHDGDDYVEGNGGADRIWGDLGRDDLIGGSSDLFGLALAHQRLDGADVIFGGDGTRIDRNHLGNTSPAGHAADSDFILGDNGRIFRLVTEGGSFHAFSYDTSPGAIRLLPRGVGFLDYFPMDAASSIGGADEIRGEDGDDTIHGMTGSDTLYGDAQDDDITGGLGNDWIYGGSGQDGLLGDDGLVSTARNGTAEPLFAVGTAGQEPVTASGVFSTTIFPTGHLQKYATLLNDTVGGDDVIYAGLGDDFVHGGEGMDAISGAEALSAFYSIAGVRPSLVYTPSLRRFTVFDPGTGLRKIANFFLNFEASISGARIDDGRDTLFGDHGHDWIVGGTNQDRIFGGMGDDVLNADDNLDTNAGLNFSADSAPYNEPDIAFGGGGLDRLIGNTTADRLIDWVDDFNQYLTPFAASSPTVIRNPTTSLITALRSLGRGGGADQLLIEPNGELGLVQSSDPEWSDQLGRPLTVTSGPTVWLGDLEPGPRQPPPTGPSVPKPQPSDGPAEEGLYQFGA